MSAVLNIMGAALGARLGLRLGRVASRSKVDLDADLFGLLARHAAAEAEMHRACTAFNCVAGAFRAALRTPPDALRWRKDDFPRTSLGLVLSTPVDDVEGEERRK